MSDRKVGMLLPFSISWGRATPEYYFPLGFGPYWLSPGSLSAKAIHRP